MRSAEAALAKKADGNTAFGQGLFEEALDHYLDALDLSPEGDDFFPQRVRALYCTHVGSLRVADARALSVVCRRFFTATERHAS